MGITLQPNTCSTCLLKTREKDGTMICRDKPPTTIAVVLPVGPGKLQQVGTTTSYTLVTDTDWCWNHTGLIRPKGSSPVLPG